MIYTSNMGCSDHRPPTTQVGAAEPCLVRQSATDMDTERSDQLRRLDWRLERGPFRSDPTRPPEEMFGARVR